MGHPLYGANKAGAVIGSSVLTIESDSLASAAQQHIRIPFDCIIREIHYAVNVLLETAKSTITVKVDGVAFTGAAAFEVADDAAVGTGGVFNLTKVAGTAATPIVKKGSILEIENDAAATAGQVVWTIVCDAT